MTWSINQVYIATTTSSLTSCLNKNKCSHYFMYLFKASLFKVAAIFIDFHLI